MLKVQPYFDYQNRERYWVRDTSKPAGSDIIGTGFVTQLEATLWASQQSVQRIGCTCSEPKTLWKESSGWYCGNCYKPANR